jgi:hypothetical protein
MMVVWLNVDINADAILVKSMACAELVKTFNQLDHVIMPGVEKWRYKQARAAFIGTINGHIDLAGEWGLIPYFNFRSHSEQLELKVEVYE